MNSRAALLRVVAQQLPQDGAGHALDQVGVADEDAVVGAKWRTSSGAPPAGDGAAARGHGLPPRSGSPRLQQVDRRAEVAGDRHQRVLVLVAEAQVLRAFDEQHAEQPPAETIGTASWLCGSARPG